MFKVSIVTFLLTITMFCNNLYCQVTHKWTDTNRKYLVENLERTKNEIIKETQNLSLEQWQFRPDSSKWSIGQVLEHLGLYERIFAQEADIMLSTKPDYLLDSLSLPDSVYLNWMNDPSPHIAEWNAEPLGLMNGYHNLTFFLFGRNNIIEFIKTTTYDLKAHFTFRWGKEQRRSIHGLLVVHFAHTDRHLKQIKRIKMSEQFPK